MKRLLSALVLAATAASASDTPVLEAEIPGEVLALTPAHIAGAAVKTNDGGPQLYFMLTAPAGRAFAKLTGKAVGEPLTLRICGQTLATAIIRTPIESGAVVVPVPDIPKGEHFADILSGRTGC